MIYPPLTQLQLQERPPPLPHSCFKERDVVSEPSAGRRTGADGPLTAPHLRLFSFRRRKQRRRRRRAGGSRRPRSRRHTGIAAPGDRPGPGRAAPLTARGPLRPALRVPGPGRAAPLTARLPSRAGSPHGPGSLHGPRPSPARDRDSAPRTPRPSGPTC